MSKRYESFNSLSSDKGSIRQAQLTRKNVEAQLLKTTDRATQKELLSELARCSEEIDARQQYLRDGKFSKQ